MAHNSTSEESLDANLIHFFNSSNVGLAIFDVQLRYLTLNARLAGINGCSIESHVGKTVREILGEEVAFQAEPAMRQVLATGQPIANVELAGTLPTSSQAKRWVDNFFPIKDPKGLVAMVGAVVVEIPKRRTVKESGRAHKSKSRDTVMRSWKEIACHLGACVKTVQRWEREYRLPVRRLKASKGSIVFAFRDEVDRWVVSKSQSATTGAWDECSWAMFTNSPLPTFIVDDDRMILDANPTVARLMGASRDEFVGKKLDSFAGSAPGHIETEWTLFRKLGGAVGLRNFCRPDGAVFAATYTLRTLLPGIRILTLTALSHNAISEEREFCHGGPPMLEH